MLAAVLAVLGPLLVIGKQIAAWFSDTNWRKRREVADAQQLGEAKVESERLKATYDRIQAEPPKEGQDLVDALNKPRP